MSIFWFVLAACMAHIVDGLAYPAFGPKGTRKRNVPSENLMRAIEKDFGVVPTGIAAVCLFIATPIRFLGSPWWGWDWGIPLGLATYGAFVLLDEPAGRAWLKKTFGKAWNRIRARLRLPERILPSEEERVLRGLEAGLLAQIGDSPLLAPIAGNIRQLVHVDAPRLLRDRGRYAEAIARADQTREATNTEPESVERVRNEAIRQKLIARRETIQALIAQIRHKLVHLGPVIDDVRLGLESGDGSDVQNALRYLDDLTAAIHASATEDMPALPTDDPAALPARTRIPS